MFLKKKNKKLKVENIGSGPINAPKELIKHKFNEGLKRFDAQVKQD